MDAASIYHFLFETAPGIGCLIGGVLVLTLIASVIMERRTRKQFVDREPGEDDWTTMTKAKTAATIRPSSAGAARIRP